MESLLTLLLYINIGWLFTHELDAIAQHEWRVFPFLSPFSDLTAYRIFVALHIPLFALILYGTQLRWFWVGFDLFLIAHALLHWVLRSHPKVEFRNGFSKLLVYGGVPLGAVHLILLGISN